MGNLKTTKSSESNKTKTKKKPWPPAMTDEELKEFVLGVVDGKIFTSRHIPINVLEKMLHLIFMPLGLGGLKEVSKKDIKNIGAFWEWTSKCMTMGINGYPMFTSCRAITKKDWARAAFAIEKEEKRRKELKV